MSYKNQKEMFLKIWEERDHVCFVSGQDLGWEPRAHYFAHVLPKGSYPKFKLNPDNIVLLTIEKHTEYDHGTSKENPEFAALYAKREQLTKEYYSKYYNRQFD